MSHKSKAAEYLSMADQVIESCTVPLIPFSSGRKKASMTDSQIQFVRMLAELARAHQSQED